MSKIKIYSNFLLSLLLLLFSKNSISQSYCTSSGNMTYATSITLVNFNTINKSSAKPSGYNDYTATSTNVTRGSTYTLTVNINTDGNYTCRCYVWFDWNNNGDFNDAGEVYNLGSVTNSNNGATSSSPYSVTIPVNANLGSVRMRVSAKYSTYPTSCETNFDGEVEDYTVTVFNPAPPTITNFTPTSGCVNSSAQVVITGTSFTAATAVNFNGVSATFVIDNSTQITATLPSSATTGTISVTNPAGTAYSSSSFIVSNSTPTITGTTPNTRCGTGSVTLGATASAGTPNWYAASTGGSVLGTGTSFTTPFISSSTTYWVDATYLGCTTASRTSVLATVNSNPVGVTATIGTAFTCYATLKAAFDAINIGTHKGVINITIAGNTTEAASAVLNASGSGSASYTSITIRPDGGVARTITGSLSSPLIDLSGADYVTIDGLNTNGNSLTIENTSTNSSASTIRFINDATFNTVTNCIIKGCGASASIAPIFFSSATTIGNDFNTISNNNIAPSGSNLPVNAIFSSGTNAKENDNISITNNTIQDFFSPTIASSGILVSSNNSTWTIIGNKLFQTATRSTTGNSLTHRAIQITSGNGYTVSNNIIGYANANGTGTTTYNTTGGSTTPLYRGIELTVGTTSTSSIQNNIISAISFSTSSGTTTAPGIFAAISVLAGKVDIGTVTGNTIGASTGNDAIYIVSTVSLGVVYGIYSTSVSTVNIQNNNIGSITMGGGATIGYTFFAISSNGTAGTYNIDNNFIGSAVTANSISVGTSATTTPICTFVGVRNAATGSMSYTNNIFQNCIAWGTGASVVYAIDNNSGSGTLNISNNQVISLTNNGTGVFNTFDNVAAFTTCTISNNIVRNLIKNAASGNLTTITCTGAITSSININNNQLGNASGDLVNYTAACSGTYTGITVTSATATCNLTITGNDFRGINYAALSTGANTYISNTAATLSQNISNNTFTNISVNTTGAIIFITNSVALPSGGSETINNNAIVGSYTREATATSGAITIYTNAGTSNNNSTGTHTNNNFSNITVYGAATIGGWISTDASNNNRTLDGNIFTNWVGGTGAITVLTVNHTGTNQTKNTIIRNIQSAGTITGITSSAGNENIFSNTIDSLISNGGVAATTVSGINISGGTTTTNIYSDTITNIIGNTLTTGSVRGIVVSAGGTANIYQNIIYGISANANTTGTINGIWISGGTNTVIEKNMIYNISSTSSAFGTNGVVNGIQLSGSTASTDRLLQNNMIADIRATNANLTTDAVRGIGIISTGTTSTIRLYYNTIHLDAVSTGTNFNVSCVYHTTSTTSTTANLDMRNNILHNYSTPNGSGFVCAYRRSAGTANALANYASSSNNNLFFAGTPGTKNLIYYDGTSSAQTINQYKLGVFTAGNISPRDQVSVSEDMISTNAFLSLDNTDPNYLHINPAAVTLVESGGVNITGITTDLSGTIRQGNPGYSGNGTAPDIGADEVNSYIITSLNGSYNVGTGQTFTSLTRSGSIFSLINNRGLSGNVILNITSDLSETGYEALGQWSEIGGSGYTITIKSSAAVVRNITGSVNNGLIRLNGADRVRIDGSINGSGRYLRFSNTNTGTSAATISFALDATYDTVKNCIIEGSSTNSVGGVVFFSTATISGNDFNVIDNNVITAAGSNLPRYSIYSAGTAAKENDNNTISNNEISNYFLATATTAGINIAANNTTWTISGNKIFQTANRVYTTAATHYGITISSGVNYTISNNIIGYGNANSTGTTNIIGNSVDLSGFPSSFTTTGTANALRYVGINCAFTAAGTTSSIQNNTIAGFALYTASNTATGYGMWCGIQVTSGNANIGTITGNTIGSTSGQNSVYAVTTTTNGAVVGIYTTSANTISIQNNKIGGINSMGTTNTITGNFTGIDAAGVANYTITNNFIGNTTESNIRTGNLLEGGNLSNTGSTFQSTTGTSSTMVGIRSSNTGNTLAITGNTIRGFATSSTVETFTGITTSGTMTGSNPSVIIEDNFLGTSGTSLINYTVANSGTLTGINVTNTIATNYSIQRNDFRGINHIVTGSSIHNYIVLSGAVSANAITYINNNTFTSLNVNTTGTITIITNSVAIPSTGIQYVNSNSIVGSFTRSANSGILNIFTSSANSTTGGASFHNNNNFSNIYLSGTANNAGWIVTDAGDANRTFQGNTFYNWNGGTGALIAFNISSNSSNTNITANSIKKIICSASITGVSTGTGNANIYNNTIDSLISNSGNSNISGISISTLGATKNVYSNTISNLINSSLTTGSINGISTIGSTTVNIYQNIIFTLLGETITSGSINGISIGGGSGSTFTVYRNKIYDLSCNSNTTSGGIINGISVTSSIDNAAITVRNNIIGDLRFPNVSSSGDVIRGLNISHTGLTSNAYVYYNTVVINAISTGLDFSTTGIYHLSNSTSTTGNLDLRNNIISNTSTANGSGNTVAFRRLDNNLNNYSTNSNNNLFFAGTPSASNLIFSDGTNTDQTLALFKTRMSTRDALSVTENLITNLKFLSITGSSSNFLMMNPAKASAVESGARNIAGVTIDYNGNTRQGNAGYTGSGTYPDIGASEYNGSVCTGSWTGLVNTNWNNISNWDCEIPTSTSNVIIPNGLTNYPNLSSGLGAINNITIGSSASVTLSGGTLQVSGNITNNGSFTVNSGSIEFNGNSAQTIPANLFATNTISNLIINNTAGVTLNGTLNITDELTINNGKINTNGYLVLKSSITKTARIATILSTDPTPVNGNITMERYIQGRRKYRLLTSSVTSSPLSSLSAGQESLSIWGNWQNSGSNTTSNIGTFITGGTSNDGFDQQTSTASMYTYDDVNRRFIAYSSANGKNTKLTPLKAGVPYYFFVYGDRQNGISTITPNATVLKATGTVLTGTQTYTSNSTIPLANVVDRFTFLGNPFASPIDWATLPKTNLYNTYWGWDPNLSSTGGYVTVNTAGSVTLISPFSGTVGLNQYIQSGQGFFVRTAATNPQLSIREIDKVSNYNTNVFRGNNDVALVAINLFYKENGQNILADGTLAAFDTSFNNSIGKYDAEKIFNSAEGVAILHENKLLSIDAKKLPKVNDSLQLYISNLSKNQYTLQIFSQYFDNQNLQPYLEDKFLHTLQLLSTSDTNYINFSVDQNNILSRATNRFKIIFKELGSLPGAVTNIKATIKTNKIVLDYTVHSNISVEKFIILKSADGINFSSIGEKIVNSSLANLDYQFTDENPFKGINYYQVKTVAVNEIQQLSKIATAKYDEQKILIRIYPNPINGKTFITQLFNLSSDNYILNIYNASGRLFESQPIQHQELQVNHKIRIKSNLPPGNYFIQVKNDKTNVSEMILINN
jgi:hypothetical protein